MILFPSGKEVGERHLLWIRYLRLQAKRSALGEKELDIHAQRLRFNLHAGLEVTPRKPEVESSP